MTSENLLAQETHFAFGKNWADYAGKIDEAAVVQAVTDLQRLIGGDLTGKAFLDIGCGSGLHSLAAIRLGAARVVGVDIDADSVATSRVVFARFAPHALATFAVSSVFDLGAQAPGMFDVVYSWGVLHHTGDMERAIRDAAALVAPDGQFVLALYKKTPFCGMWRHIKRWYSRATPVGQARAQKAYVALRKLVAKVRGRDFDAYIKNYASSRGMNFYNDVHDWLGGYPYESISPAACHALLARFGFQLEREYIATPGHYLPGLLGSGCDEYVFRRVRG